MAKKPISLDEYHRQGQDAVRRRNRDSLGLPRARWSVQALKPYLFSRWTAWGLMAGALLGLASASPWTPTPALRHALSRTNCAAARAMGLAPARREEPGYWRHNDRDGDGIACEPWPGRRH